MRTIHEYNRWFWNFVNAYDTHDENILRKIVHSYEVANYAFKIACNLEFDAKQRLFAYVCGLFHDLGRFEQWKIYQTYNDKISVDHGEISFEILEQMDCENVFDLSKQQIEILKNSVRYHTKQYNGNDKDIILYAKIVKNADAMANINTTANGTHQIHSKKDGVTPEILQSFLDMAPLWPYKYETKLDRCFMMVANCYYVRFPFLRKQILEEKLIDIMVETFSNHLSSEDKQIFKSAVEKIKVKYVQSCHKTIEEIEQNDRYKF